MLEQIDQTSVGFWNGVSISTLAGRTVSPTASAVNFFHDPADRSANKVSVRIDPASVDTNHAKRDEVAKERFLQVADFPEATFESTKYSGSDTEGVLEGVLTLRGVSQPISVDIKKVGEGKDPWGGYRAGFSGKVALDRTDWGIAEGGPG